MELVPIVQLSLSIFTGGLVLVLAVSYLSFKIKKNATVTATPVGKQINQMSNYISQQQPPVYYNQPATNYYTAPQQIPVSVPEFRPVPSYVPPVEEAVSVKAPVNKFQFVNRMPSSYQGYLPETDSNFSHKFASSKSKDAYAMFR
ncbi:MAG: hypothetical protein WCJ01_04780 [Ignavibacteria bacterium]